MPPNSTSELISTESIACASGYKNSCIEIGISDSKRLVKSSLSIMRATVYLLLISITSEKFILLSQVLLNKTLRVFTSSITLDCSIYDSALAFASSRVSCGRVLLRSEGSPIIAVKSPITRIAWCPKSWKSLNFWRTTLCPICRSGLLGSQPSFTTRGLLFLIEDSSLCRRS